ncbi:DNA gyrase inhibitor YacG [Roseinatronobacter alkalisoli]|uniref:DNA gyrase inhibitor YacG n=1 Tax=Roseinatronobacter alkalisoli TaxID=3028235 RepID=A0ABT5T3C9_9RHOB|nr:DNA gyrase inhibitor YacG [Roseinatronobacter sp. HJB301]MDD7969629.1 DNA gyrase inhibitor YacG [Roseinatronobacter sp. HJB301]
MRCPVCKQATVPAFRPFCSQRCADIDLGRWLREEYSIPGPDADIDADIEEKP